MVPEVLMEESASKTNKTKSFTKILSDRLYSYLLLLPAMAVILSFSIFPLVYAIAVAFHYVDLTLGGEFGQFVGLKNFKDVLDNSYFWGTVYRTLFITIFAVSTEMVLGVGLAFLLNQLRWFKGIVRALFLLPLAAAPAAISMIWRYMYNPEFGVYNAILAKIGLPTPNWLGDLVLAPFSIIAFDVWQWTPFVTLIVLAGLQSLPREPFEAAELDGASSWMVFRKLTFPMLYPVLMLVFILRVIDLIRLYDPIATMTLGGPGTATETITFYIYRVGLRYFRLDQASAMSLLMLYAIVVFSAMILRPLMRMQSLRAERGSRR
jgi:multiple sugar transport system permease protein